MGIANIVNTAGGGGGSSEIITHLVNSVDGAGLRLANQGYISCADVSANRFGTNDFSVEFVLSQETSAINADIFISNFNSSNQAVDAAVIRWDVVQNDNIQLVFTNSGATETAYNFGYDPAPDLNEPTHYLVSADRSGNAVLYRNGAEIASVSIAASSSANVGNSGQPTVIGSPVNNFGVKGNVYRFRTYSKALSSDEAKNVFDRADVPTALVSNLLLDLDCAYANPTQSTVIQDRGPNNQDGTLNGTITQTNVIKQLNSTSARVGTSAATPADGEIIATGVKAETYRSARSDGDVYIQAATASDFVAIGTQVSSTLLKLDGNGNLMLGTPAAGSAGAILHISSAAPRIRLEDTSAPANYSQIAADNGQLTLAADGGQGQASSAIIAQVDSYERMRIDSSGGVKVFGSGSPGAILRLENTTTSAAADDIAGTVNFYTNEASVPAGGRVCGYIRSVADDQYNRYGLRFGTANYNETVAERMSIDASGTTTFQKTGGAIVNLKRVDSDILDGNTFGRLQAISGDSNHTAGTEVGSIAFTAYGDQTGTRPVGQIRFQVANNATQAEAMRIEPTKLVKFYGGIAQGGTSGDNTAYIDTSGQLYISRPSGTGRNHIIIINDGSTVGSITSNASATQYNTSSDYRLKENLEPLTGALDRINQLPVYRFNFKADPDTTVDGFVAHEVQAHVPEAITGEKDGMRTVVVQEAVEAVEAVAATYWEEGDELPEGVAVGDEKTAAVEAVEAVEEVTEEQPDYQGIDQSKLVPLLVAAVKELKAKVETLENA